MTVTKEWENALDERASEPVTMNVIRGTEKIDEIEMSNDLGWTKTYFIATGQMTVDETTGKVNIFAEGHDYTMTEPERLSYYWDLKIETVRPMIINGTLTFLVLEDKYTRGDGRRRGLL